MSGLRKLAQMEVQKGRGGKKGKGEMSKLDAALKAKQPKKKR